MEKGRVALPSKQPGGLDAQLDAHFGHCEMYTVVDMENGQVKAVGILPSVPHQQGGCMAPVQYLADNNVQFLISGGMGMRPLMGFQQVGIQVYHAGNNVTVKQAVDALAAGNLQIFTTAQTCGGGGQPGR